MTENGGIQPSFRGHLKIARIDHWVKNVFVLPGVVAGLSFETWSFRGVALRFAIGMASVCLIASSNYTINEILDAPFDRVHPTKRRRPVPLGEVHVPLAYAQWLVIMLGGMALAATISRAFAATMFVLWMMGCIYNIPPLRSKDQPYLDVLSESINNPLRLLAGWFIVGDSSFPSGSLLMSYWMVGCYFMAIKRFAELRDIGDPRIASAYRRSFAYYNQDRLLVSVMFYGSTAMLFLGTFCMRYRLELLLSYPWIAAVMAVYLKVGLKPASAAQAPEALHRERGLMILVVACAIVIGILLFIDIPVLHRIFAPTMRLSSPTT